MCGRYALGLRPSEVFTALQNDGMEIHESLSSQDKDVPLPNFNLAPGNFGLVYLAQKHQYASGSSEEIVVESNCNKAQKDDPNLHKITYKLQVLFELVLEFKSIIKDKNRIGHEMGPNSFLDKAVT